MPDRLRGRHVRRYTDGDRVCPGQASSQLVMMSRTDLMDAGPVGQLDDCLALSILGDRKSVYGSVLAVAKSNRIVVFMEKEG